MTRLRIIVNLFTIAAIIFAAITLRARSRVQHLAASPADPLAILDRRVPMVDFAGASLPEAAETLSKAAGVRIAVDPDAAEIAGRVDASEITLGGITLEENLRQLISRFGGLSYVVEPGGIRITTSSRAPLSVRIYDVRDVQQKIAATIPRQRPAYVGFGSRWMTVTKVTPQLIDQLAMDRITGLIRYSVTRENWVEDGGSPGSMHDEVNGFLVVTQTPASHRRIIQLLSAIRRAAQSNGVSLHQGGESDCSDEDPLESRAHARVARHEHRALDRCAAYRRKCDADGCA